MGQHIDQPGRIIKVSQAGVTIPAKLNVEELRRGTACADMDRPGCEDEIFIRRAAIKGKIALQTIKGSLYQFFRKQQAASIIQPPPRIDDKFHC
jgi:hypothetical protein